MAGRTDLEQLVYQMSTDIRALERQNKRALANVDSTANKIEARYKKVGKADVGKFLDQTFDKTRLAAFEVGASRVPIFGAALEALGPAGFAAAAGIGAVALATVGAMQAMQFADEIDDAATKLNVGTEALQEYRFALTEVGGEAKDADAAIEGFQKKLGEGLAGGRSVKWFERLGFSAEDLKAFDSTEEALEAVLDKISALGSEAERAAVAEKLGLGPMVALAREGSDRLDELRQRARDLGLVMDAELVARGAEANQQFETMAKIIDVQLKSALVDLGPVIVDVMRFVAWLAEGLADVADAFRSIEDRSRRSLMKEYNAHGEIMTGMMNRRGVNSPDDLNPLARRQFNQSNARRGQIAQELADRPPAIAPGNRPGARLEPLGGGGGSRGGGRSGPSAEEIDKRTAELERTLAIEIARLQNNEELVQVLEREAAVARRIEQYRSLGKSAAEAEASAAADQLRIDEARRDGMQEELRIAGIQQGVEYEQILGNQRFAQTLQDRLTLQRAIESYVQKGYDLGTATNAAERDLLEIQQARAEVMARIVADAALERQITLSRLAGDEANLRNLERAREIQARARDIEGREGLNSGEGVRRATAEVDEEIAAASRRGFRDGVRGMLDDLQDGGLEGVLTSIFDRVSDRMKDNLADLITDVIFSSGSGKKGGGGGWADAVGSFLGGLGRRERGGPVRAGRAYVVGEKRPELFVPGTSGTIVPSIAAAGLRTAPPAAQIAFSMTIDLAGANGDQTIRRIAYQAAEEGARAAVARAAHVSRKSLPAMMDRHRKLGTT